MSYFLKFFDLIKRQNIFVQSLFYCPIPSIILFMLINFSLRGSAYEFQIPIIGGGK